MERDIYKVTAKIIYKLAERLEMSETKAILSSLRNSIGRNMTETISVWPIMFEELPQEYLSLSGIPTHQENAILSSLQLYALHQQGENRSVHEPSGKNIGSALSNIRDKDNTALDRRFNALVTSGSFEELITHLRYLMSILKQKSEIRVDYAKLAEDLYWYQLGPAFANRMRMRWGQNYYQIRKKEGEQDEK